VVGTLVPPLGAARLVQARPGRGRLAMMAVPGGVSHEQRDDAAARAARIATGGMPEVVVPAR